MNRKHLPTGYMNKENAMIDWYLNQFSTFPSITFWLIIMVSIVWVLVISMLLIAVTCIVTAGVYIRFN